ncbi:alpha/beta hydrolase family protein [Spirilliplanes yamanashiensis]|uniref:alpha/beta hydrolase family protein n=1 Tax=Spirilliplanes yamanashiensis TaxID=42233 RepID=UPI00351F9E31
MPAPHEAGVTPPTLSFVPVVLPSPGRAVDLAVRVTAPATGDRLPIILLAHGHGPSNYVSSYYGYAPLADHYAAHGFVVVQPTFLDSAMLGLRDADDPDAPLYWRRRALDMRQIIDDLDAIEAAVPLLAGRADRDRIAVVGHSMGGHTACLLLGARLTDPADGSVVDLRDPRITAGVVMAAPGRGGDALSAYAAEHHPFLGEPDFSTMTTPALVVAGENDDVPYLTTAGPGWSVDPYTLSPAGTLLTVLGAEHGLGGIAGYDLRETTDEHPRRADMVRRVTAAFLRARLLGDDASWRAAVATVGAGPEPLGRIESKEPRPA